MLPGRNTNTIRQWMFSMFAVIAVLGLNANAFGQDDKSLSDRRDRDSSALNRSASHNADDFRMAPRWQKATDLKGKNVTNSENENLGEIKDIVVDPNSGRILYAVLEFGGFLGMGEKLFAVPFQSLQSSGDNKAFILNVEKDRLKSAPGFDKSQWPNFADEQFATTTYQYYSLTPYWQVRNDNASGTTTHREHSSKTSTGGSNDNGSTITTTTTIHYRDRWNQRATAWQKGSDLCGKNVVDSRNENTGKLSDCVIDPDGARIVYGVVSFRDKYFAVPWSALTLPADAKQFVLNGNNDQLKDSVSFGKDNWPNMTDERWARDTFTYYRVQPYWTKSDTTELR